MKTQGNCRLRVLILGVTAALASCLLALAFAAPPAQAASQPYDLSISQTDGPDPLENGYLVYGLTVKHELVESCGPLCYWSGNLRVTNTLPPGVTLVDVNPSINSSLGYRVSISCSGTSTVACTLNGLDDGDSVDIDIAVKPNSGGAQTLTNTATVSSANSDFSSDYPDPNTSNNSSTATTQVSASYTPPSDSYTRPPTTTLIDTPNPFSSDVGARLSFTSNDANATFECKLDNAAFASCASPKQYLLLSEGQHAFEVRSKDASGNVDPTPAKHTWTVDTIRPKITFTQRPGTATGPYADSYWITNDTTPTWAWTIADANPSPGAPRCYIYDRTNSRYILSYISSVCSSPFTFGAELPDAEYSFHLEPRDQAGNYGYASNYFEVDTVAPKVSTIYPTGRLVGRYPEVEVTFDDYVYRSKQFVNIYRKGTTTPIDVYRYDGGGSRKVVIYPKNALRSDTWYKVKVTTGVNDGANNLEAPKTWSFKTK